jgi:hypothetical protein
VQYKELYVCKFCRWLQLQWSKCNSVSIATRLRAGRSGFDTWQGQGKNHSLLLRVQNCSGSHPAPYPTVIGVSSLGVKRPRGEADHSHSSTAEVKNAWSSTSTPQYVFMTWFLIKEAHLHGVVLNIGQLYLFLYLRASVRMCTQKFPDWPPGARTANGTALCH